MRLFVANPTRQVQDICYRVDFDKDGRPVDPIRTRFQPARQQSIPPGRQIQIGDDMHFNAINDIVEQMKPYGMIGVVDIPRMERKVVPYIFNIDGYVPANAIRNVQAHNTGIQIADGQQRRQKAAIANNALVQNTVESEFIAAGIPDAPSSQVEIAYEQEEQSEAGEKTIAEGYRVSANAPDQPPDQPRAKRKYTRRKGA